MAVIESQLEEYLQALISNLSSSELRKLNRTIATKVRNSQAKRIKDNKNPDGTAYLKRQRSLKTKKGRIKANQKMFINQSKLKNFKVKSDARGFSIALTGRVSAIHQFGLVAKVNKNGTKYKFPTRKLLGFSKKDRNIIEQAIFEQLKLD